MLSVSNISSAGQGMSYYASDNYYTKEEGVENSEWYGEGAKELGLSGQIDKENFQKLLNGEVDGQQLGKMEKDENGGAVIKHRAGVDLTFSAPKSVSVMAEIYEDERVKEAHKEAVNEVLDSISNEAISTRVMKDGVMTNEKSNKMIVAKFDHDTNRNQDPNTHTHTLILNAVKSEDGSWKSIDNKELYDSQRLYGAMYTNKLAEKIQDLGYEITIKDDKGNFEINGVGDEAVNKFSSRKNEIDEKLKEMGMTREEASASQRETATLSTREKKTDLAHDELREGWRKTAKDVVEVDGEQLIQESTQRKGIESQDNQYYEADKAAKTATRGALKSLTEREAVVDSKELRQKAYERGVGTTSTKNIDKHLGSLEKEGVVLKVNEGESTTKAVLNSEKWTIKTMNEGKGVIEKVVDDERVVDHIIAFEKKEGFKLKEGQAQAVKTIFNTKDRYIGVQGLAGTGKTTMLQVVKNVADDNNITIRGMSGTKKAANTLMKESGIKSDTNAMFIIKARQAQKQWEKTVKEDPNAKREKEVWVVDESSFAGQKDLNSIADLAVKADARVVFIGDKLQLQSISFGKPFEVAQDKGIQTAEMKDINRQKTESLKTLVNTTLGNKRDSLESQNIEKAMNFMRKEGMIVEVKDKPKKEGVEGVEGVEGEKGNEAPPSLNTLVGEYLSMSKEERGDTKIITPFNTDRVQANEIIREGLKDKQEISGIEEKLEVYKPTGKTSVEMNDAWHYKEGEIVVFGAAVKHLGIEKNEAFRITGLDDKRTTVFLENEDGRQVDWKPAKRHRAIAYEAEEIKLSEGDQIRFTKNDADSRYTNNMEASVVGVSKGGVVNVATEDGKQFTLGEKDKFIDYNYTSTVYGSQGSTYKNTFLYVNMPKDLNENQSKAISKVVGDRMLYVAMTRSKERFELYTPDADSVEKVVQMKQDKRFALGEIEDKQNNSKVNREGFDKNSDNSEYKKTEIRNIEKDKKLDVEKNNEQKMIKKEGQLKQDSSQSLKDMLGEKTSINEESNGGDLTKRVSGSQDRLEPSVEGSGFKGDLSVMLDQAEKEKERSVEKQLQL